MALLSGFLGSGKTTFVRALLSRPGMRDTLVVVNEFGAVGIDHELIEAVHDDVVLLRGGCLCCGVRQDLARTLRDLHRRWQGGQVPRFARVVIEASGLAEAGAVAGMLLAHPLVSDAYALRSITTLVDAEYGAGQLSRHPTCRRQVAAADRILLTKPDRAAAAAQAGLRRRLAAMNALAPVEACRFGDADATPLFAPAPVPRLRRRPLAAEHDDDIISRVLTADAPLAWPAVQRFLAALAEAMGERLLRLKGILDLAGEALPVVVQAVQHSYYPLETLPAWGTARRASRLVLITEGALPAAFANALADCSAAAPLRLPRGG